MADRLRLFIAIYPPEDTSTRLLGLLKGLDLADHRPVPPAQVHLTLLFIGPTEASKLDTVCESVERSCAGIGPFALQPDRLETMPSRGTPRLLACTTDVPPGLMEIHRRLVGRLARPTQKKSKREFLPHLTLCRFSKSGTPNRLSQNIDEMAFEVDDVRLIKSVLKPTGAEHALVERFTLRP